MKKTTMAVLTLSLFAAAVGARALEAGKQPHPEMGKRIKDALGLTPEQSDKMKAAMKAHRAATKPVRRKLEDLEEKLGEQLEAKAADKDIQGTLDQIASARKEMEAERDKMEAAVASILTPTQRAKMAVGMMHRMRSMGRGGMRGGPHGEAHGHEGPGPEGEGDKPDED